MSDPAAARLQRVLGGEDLAGLRQRLRRRFEQAERAGDVATMRLTALTPAEHAALAALLGRPPRYAASMTFDVAPIDAALRNAGLAESLHDALVRIDGPIVHVATARLHAQAQWSAVVESCAHDGLRALVADPAGFQLLRRLTKQRPERAAELCRRAEAVLQRLPCRGITRAQLAADALGDAHALDAGQATAALTVAVLTRSGGEIDRDAARPRDIWARAGVLVNELARPALHLNLPAVGARDRGEPAYSSLRSLLRAAPSWLVAGCAVHVCENPNLVAIAADRWGSDCAPLVCVEGMPGAAQRCLLSQLVQAGAQLLYHGDFDWPGIRIANHVMRTFGAQPWRFAASDYRKAIMTAQGLTHALTGPAVDAMWDPALATAMRELGTAIAEEGLAAVLLPDLAPRR